MKVVITGASSGLGAAISKALEFSNSTGRHGNIQTNFRIWDWSRETGVDISNEYNVESAKRDLIQDLKNDEIFSHAATDNELSVDVLINCAGINHLDYIEDLETEAWDKVLNTNAKGIYLVSKALLPLLAKSNGTILNIVSNASHMPMTSSLAYNASKGAAEIMTKQMSRELIKTHGITVFGISPNKLRGTGMSEYIDNRVQEIRGWTAQQARDYQIANLPAGEETEPATLAEFIAFLLSSRQRHRYLAGCIIPYGL